MGRRVSIIPSDEPASCPDCNRPMLKRETRRRKLKRHQSYYFLWFWWCRPCRKMVHDEEAKRYVTAKQASLGNRSGQGSLFPLDAELDREYRGIVGGLGQL